LLKIQLVLVVSEFTNVTDGRTDGQTDTQTPHKSINLACMASRDKNCQN